MVKFNDDTQIVFSETVDGYTLEYLKYKNTLLINTTISSNGKGHYLPSTGEASNFLRVFKNGGVNVDDATLTILKEDGTLFKQISPTHGNRLDYY